MYPGLVEHDTAIQHLYRSLDLLYEHKEEIENYLFSYGKNLFDTYVDVVLYDLTTLRFESTRTSEFIVGLKMKGTLKSRPMFHWTDQRIIGHLMLCFLSHFCEAHLTKLLRKAGLMQHSKATENGIIKERPLTVKSAMHELNQVMAVPIKIKKETIWIRTDIPPNAIKLLKAIGMQIPPKILPQTENVVAQTHL